MGNIRIDHAQGALRAEGLAFVRHVYHAAFGTTPEDEPDHLFVARRGAKIVGTMGINFWPEHGLPRLARIYRFDWTRAPRPVDAETFVEFVRFTGRESRLSEALIYASTGFALRHGKTCGWCEHTDKALRIIMQMGLEFHLVEAELRPHTVDRGDRAYYERNTDVRLYMIDLARIVDVLHDRVQSYIT